MSGRRAAAGLAVSAAFIALLLWRVDLGELRDAFGSAQLGWLAASLPIYVAVLWLRGVRWRILLRGTTELGAADSTALVAICYAANNVVPARAGELLRAQLLYDRHGADRLAALGSIVVERVLDGLTLALFLAGTIAIAGGNDALRALAVAATALFAGLALVLAAGAPALARRPERSGALLRRLPARARPRARRWCDGFVQGLTGVRGASAWGAVVALSAASWATEAALCWVVAIGFGLDLHPLLYLGACGVANLATVVPLTSGGVGPYEYAAREFVVYFGAGAAVGTAYALALHALLIVPVSVLGLALLWRRHIAVRSVLRGAPEGAAAADAAGRARGSG